MSKTFLLPNIDNSLQNIPDFYLARKDRIGRRGGGLITYITPQFFSAHFLIKLYPSLCLLKFYYPLQTICFFNHLLPPNSPIFWVDDFDTFASHTKYLMTLFV